MANRESSKYRVLAVYPGAIENRWREGHDDGYSILDPFTDTHLGISETSFTGAWNHAASKLPAPIEDAPTGQASIIASPLNHNMPSAAPESAEPLSPDEEIIHGLGDQLRDALATIERLQGRYLSLSLAVGKPVTSSRAAEYYADSLRQRAEKAEAEVERLSPKASEWIACPCCGFLTLTARSEYEVCPVCFWEDESILNDKDVQSLSGPNHMSLEVGRANYQNFGACDPAHVNNVRAPLAHEIPRKPSDFNIELDRRVAAIHRRGRDISDTAVRQLKEER